MKYFCLAIILVLVIVTLCAIIIYNSLIRLHNDSEEAFSNMDVFLKKRFDLMPNLIETVKAYCKHESSVFVKLAEYRSKAINASHAKERIEADNMLTSALKALFVVSEAYPELKANVNFLDLQKQLKRVEEEISGARRYYNAVVKRYNIRCEIFPSCIIASVFHFEPKPLYIIEKEEREEVKMNF